LTDLLKKAVAEGHAHALTDLRALHGKLSYYERLEYKLKG
jgi:hypothetical protein